MTPPSDNDDDEAEQLSPRVVHYHQTKQGTESANSKFNTMMLACILAIIGFLGIQIWNMNDRLARVETNVSTLLGRP